WQLEPADNAERSHHHRGFSPVTQITCNTRRTVSTVLRAVVSTGESRETVQTVQRMIGRPWITGLQAAVLMRSLRVTNNLVCRPGRSLAAACRARSRRGLRLFR